MVAAGGWLRQVVGLVVAAMAAWAAISALMLDVAHVPFNRALQESPAFVAAVRPTPDVSTWPNVAIAAYATAGLLGMVVAIRGRRWPRMGSRYDRGGEPAEPTGDVDMWRALDAGQDPTV